MFSPIIDHSFTSLDQDKVLKETNYEILFEIIAHIVVLTMVFLVLDKMMDYIINTIREKDADSFRRAAELLTAITLIGLQNNLIKKLMYITHEHPFREVKIEH